MTFEKIGIATARIKLDGEPYFFEHLGYWVWDIYFEDSSTISFYNLAGIKLGDTKEEADEFYHLLKTNFKKADIFNGEKVAVMFRENGTVRAVSSWGKDCWIDAEDKFVLKTFEELNLVITSLIVY